MSTEKRRERGREWDASDEPITEFMAGGPFSEITAIAAFYTCEVSRVFSVLKDTTLGVEPFFLSGGDL